MKKLIAMALACSFSAVVPAEDLPFNSRWYGGIGVGLSRLKPDTNNTGFSVSDSSSNGFKVYAGYDWNEKFSIEAYFADLGEAELSPNGTIEYRDGGLSGLYYFYNNRGDSARRDRTNLSLFAKAGLGYMKNSGDVNYDRIHDAHVLLGAGLEYGFSNGIAVRAEAEFFDEDSQLVSISVLKRFGKASKVAAPMIAPVQEPAVVAAVEKDSDGDGILDKSDECPNSKADARVDTRGCEIADIIVLEGVRFEINSAQLKDVSQSVLDDAAATLKRNPQVVTEVAGHTDSSGSSAFNQQLSENRANAVRSYLASKGAPIENLTAKGYGESQPIADNTTREGRSKNRRVELRILKR
jgi:outer membrane protein OmpA-like peptidoglycan-associated protein